MYRDATETGGVGFSAGAVEYGWCPSPSPLPPSSPALRARKGELASGTTPWPPVRCHQGRGRGGRRESMLALPHAMTARVQYVPNKKFGFLIAR